MGELFHKHLETYDMVNRGASIPVHTLTYSDTYTHVHTCIHIHTVIHNTYIRTYTYIQWYIYIHTYVHTHTYSDTSTVCTSYVSVLLYIHRYEQCR